MSTYTLIADSGATKTDWALVAPNGEVKRIATQGINPFHQAAEAVIRILEDELKPKLTHTPAAIYFYGAGCTPQKCIEMKAILEKTLPGATAEVYSDLWGAARALCGRNAGIACILGTGTNSCYYDGTKVCQNTPPLGYILGDEGSGAAMGKRLLGEILKGLAPSALCDAFFSEMQTTYAGIIESVYRKPLAGRYLARFSYFAAAHRDDPFIAQMLEEHFTAFFHRNLDAYAHNELPVHLVGSIAHVFRPEIERAAAKCGYTIGNIMKGPIEGLIAYHAQ